MDKIMAYPIMTTPALVVDEQVLVSGRMPSKDELLAWLDRR
ncbi:thioredoxin family protein [Dechloromonas sp. ARDL1]